MKRHLLLDSSVYSFMYTPKSAINPDSRTTHSQLGQKAQIIFSAIIERRADLIIPSVMLIEIANILSRVNNNRQFVRDVMSQIDSFANQGRAEIIRIDDSIIQTAISFCINNRVRPLCGLIAAIYLDHPSTVVTTNVELIASFARVNLDTGNIKDTIETLDLNSRTIQEIEIFFS